MPDRPIHSRKIEELDELSDELLEAITLGEGNYPWNPADPEAEAYFAELEADFSVTDCFDSREIEAQAETFFSQLHQCWEKAKNAQEDKPD